MALRNDVQSGAMNLKEKLSIELSSDARRGKVTYGGHIFNAKVCTILYVNCLLISSIASLQVRVQHCAFCMLRSVMYF